MNSKKITEIKVASRKTPYSLEDLKNAKSWSIERILNEIWFFESEEKKREIEKIIHSRKDGKVLFEKTLNGLSGNMCVSKNTMEKMKEQFDDCPEKPETADKKYVMLKKEYDLKMGKLKLIEAGLEKMSDDVENGKEAYLVLLIHDLYGRLLEELPPKSIDSHASRKGIIVRRTPLKEIRKRINDYLDTLNLISKTRSQKLTSSYIKSQIN